MGCGFSSWSPRLANCSIITPLDALTESFEKVTYARGCDVEVGFGGAFLPSTSAVRSTRVDRERLAEARTGGCKGAKAAGDARAGGRARRARADRPGAREAQVVDP